MSSGTFLGYRDKHGNEMHCARTTCGDPACSNGCIEPVALRPIGSVIPNTRDYFAAQALLTSTSGSPKARAKWAYEVADAMLKARLHKE